MKKTLILHIGMGKTGTTMLQNYFWSNRQALAEAGIEYPSRGLISAAHHLLSPHMPKFLRKQWSPERAEDWAPALAACAQPTVLLSSELMFSATGDEVSQYFEVVKKHFSPRVVVYLRRQDDLIDADYNQMVKAGLEKRRLHDMLDIMISRFDYGARLAPWTEALGRENIVVRPYEIGQFHDGELQRDFLYHTFKLDPGEQFTTSRDNPNPRLPPDLLEYKRLLNNLIDDAGQNKRANVVLEKYATEANTATVAKPGMESILSGAQRQRIARHFVASNARIARDLMGRGDGRLFYEKTPTNDEEAADNTLQTDAIQSISHFLGTLDAQLAKDISKLVREAVTSEDPAKQESALLLATAYTA